MTSRLPVLGSLRLFIICEVLAVPHIYQTVDSDYRNTDFHGAAFSFEAIQAPDVLRSGAFSFIAYAENNLWDVEQNPSP